MAPKLGGCAAFLSAGFGLLIEIKYGFGAPTYYHRSVICKAKLKVPEIHYHS
jgi:hypothetical protein